jgi:hypothetical protein
MRARFLAACRWLTWGTWEFGRGIDIDQDGGVEGSGLLLRLEPPRWLRRWASRRLPPRTEQEMRFARLDISDVVLGGLLTGVRPEVLDRMLAGYAPGVIPEIAWVEDRLNPRPWRP